MLLNLFMQVAGNDKPNGFGTLKTDNASDLQSTSVDNQLGGSIKLMQLGNSSEGAGLRHLLQFRNDDPDGSFGKTKLEEAAKPDVSKADIGAKGVYESLAHTNLSISLGSPGVNLSSFPSAVVDEKEHSKTSPFIQQGNRSRHLLPKPPKLALATGSEANAGMSQVRVARPPAEGRGRNQLLPRYWPRITDQELQQISGEYPFTVLFKINILIFHCLFCPSIPPTPPKVICPWKREKNEQTLPTLCYLSSYLISQTFAPLTAFS